MNPEQTVNGVPMVLKINQLIRGRNPRTFFDPQEMSELVDSVRASGIAQPILVRPLEDGTYRIIAGERRVRAALMTLLAVISATVVTSSNDRIANSNFLFSSPFKLGSTPTQT